MHQMLDVLIKVIGKKYELSGLEFAIKLNFHKCMIVIPNNVTDSLGIQA